MCRNGLMATQLHTEIPPTPFSEPAEQRPKPVSNPKKKLIRRTDRDHSQITRRSFQAAFLLLNVWIGSVFYYWVRQFEPGGSPTSLQRPAGVEGWLPIAALMNLRYFLLTHRVPTLYPAGTISEYLWRAGQKLFRRNFFLPRWLDIPLRGLKYLLLGFFVWAVTSMAADELAAFMNSPYGVIADVKMLNFFRHLGEAGAITLAVLAAGSLLIQNFWCRYLCPYGALLGITSLASPARIRRNPETCIDCAKCAKACPSALPVDRLITIKSAECTGCLECVAVCPAKDALSMSLSLPKI